MKKTLGKFLLILAVLATASVASLLYSKNGKGTKITGYHKHQWVGSKVYRANQFAFIPWGQGKYETPLVLDNPGPGPSNSICNKPRIFCGCGIIFLKGTLYFSSGNGHVWGNKNTNGPSLKVIVFDASGNTVWSSTSKSDGYYGDFTKDTGILESAVGRPIFIDHGAGTKVDYFWEPDPHKHGIARKPGKELLRYFKYATDWRAHSIFNSHKLNYPAGSAGEALETEGSYCSEAAVVCCNEAEGFGYDRKGNLYFVAEVDNSVLQEGDRNVIVIAPNGAVKTAFAAMSYATNPNSSYCGGTPIGGRYGGYFSVDPKGNVYQLVYGSKGITILKWTD